jgi:transcription elongation factor GreA
MSDAPEYLSKEKYEELKLELEHLKTVRRKEIAESLEYAKSLGDLAENAEYHEARETQANIEDRIKKLEVLLQSAVIVNRHHTEVVGIGSSVLLERGGEKKHNTYKIVGSEEADLANGKLSVASPLGHILLGKKKGDAVVVKAPGGDAHYTIVDIR